MSDESTTTDFPKAYDPTVWEDRLYARWEKSGFFNPDACIAAGVTAPDAGPFSIVLPPPNVTGTLHTGSACMLAIEDLIVRFKRMQGYRTLWVPGTDHAAIATQSKVEKIIYQSEGKTRHDLGREELLRRVEAFAQESHDTIVHQTKKLGSSLDWSREAYTLDDKRSLAVRTAFKRMYDDGLIYRGNRIVNWDPNLQTTVSDDEIEWREEKIPFYYLQYGPFVISTARPETKFGDKYVVMHPDDERYAAYADGQKLTVEWINGPIEATIVKDTVIDMAFGTGVMTITPWHDHTDFDIAERHGLDREQIIGEDGKLLAIAGEFSGLPIAEAREQIIAALIAKGLVVKTDADYVHNVAINRRGGGNIEPHNKRQWFVAVNKEFERAGRTVTLKTLMQDAVRSKAVDILPERFE
ncbi:MAG: class I tRNA ligase family protein, partial [Candidatus Moraniibacteriota bacterium]